MEPPTPPTADVLWLRTLRVDVHAPRSASPVPNSKTTAPCTPPCTPYRERATTFLNTEAPLVSTNCLHPPSRRLHLPACPTLTSRHLCGRRGGAYILPTTASTLELRANPGPTQNWVSFFRQRLPPGHPGVSELGDIILGGEGRRSEKGSRSERKDRREGSPEGTGTGTGAREGGGRERERKERTPVGWLPPRPLLRSVLVSRWYVAFIYSSDKYLLSTYYALGTVLGLGILP